MIEEAAAFFAEVGFEGATRALAARLGVTQALIYRYFPSKQDLIDAALAEVFGDRWNPEWEALLADAARPLEERRSEEHTSELQSLMRTSYAVFCLKKKTETEQTTTIHLIQSPSVY